MKQRKQKKYVSPSLNMLITIIGLLGVWQVTHNMQAVAWALFASLHIELRIDE